MLNKLRLFLSSTFPTYKSIRFISSISITMNGVHASVVDSTQKIAIRQAANLLESGQVIALPTDTVYGLACNANDQKAIQKLYAIKGRNENKPVAICVAECADVRVWGEAEQIPANLLERLLPGPVTVVVRKSCHLDNPFLNPGTNKIGIRVPDFNFIRDIARCVNFPVALTSANKSSEPSTLNVREFEHLWSDLGAVFDGGQLGSQEQRAASTVIDLSEKGYYTLVRKGIAVQRTIGIVEQYGLVDKTIDHAK